MFFQVLRTIISELCICYATCCCPEWIGVPDQECHSFNSIALGSDSGATLTLTILSCQLAPSEPLPYSNTGSSVHEADQGAPCNLVSASQERQAEKIRSNASQICMQTRHQGLCQDMQHQANLLNTSLASLFCITTATWYLMGMNWQAHTWGLGYAPDAV